MFNILSWNIQQGGGSRTLRIISYLISKNPNVIILSEFKNNPNGVQLRSHLTKYDYIHQAVSPASKDLNGVLLASKHPFNSVLFKGIDPNFSHCIVKGEFEAFDIYGVYLPHKKKHTLFEFFHEHLGEKPSIIAGDFNTGKNYIDQKGNSFWYTEQLSKLESMGYQDAFRHIHAEAKEFSWYSHKGNGYRYDHTYVHESLLPIVNDCYYDHEAREKKLADHSPMFLKLG